VWCIRCINELDGGRLIRKSYTTFIH
jgi:hypothetical protein